MNTGMKLSKLGKLIGLLVTGAALGTAVAYPTMTQAKDEAAPSAFVRHVCTIAEVGVGYDGEVVYVQCVQPLTPTMGTPVTEFSTNSVSGEILKNRKLNIALIAKAANKKVSIGTFNDAVDGAVCVKATTCLNIRDIAMVD
jgi:hypothetical protein